MKPRNEAETLLLAFQLPRKFDKIKSCMYVCVQKDNNSQREKHEREGITHESTQQMY